MSAPERTLALAPSRGRSGAAGDAPLRVSLPRRDLVQVMMRRGCEAALAAAMRGAFGLELPEPCRAASGDGVSAIWIQPGAWMLAAPAGEEGAFVARVAATCAGLAAVEDQSHGRATIALSGPSARAVLARLCRLDLHPRVFGPGHAATTEVAHVACLLHQVDAAPTFELTVAATLAEDVWQSLMRAGAAFGVEVA